jgi:dihydrofolate reductase
MTPLVLKMSISLDGYVARTDGSNDWMFPSYSDDATAWTVDTLRGAGAHLVGSNTYRGMAAHWPHDDSPFAEPMNSIPKIVFSATMKQSIWGDTTFIDDDLTTAITELKQRSDDGYLLAHGGAEFVRSLCRADLIDEVRLLVHPVVLGSGERIFADPMNLEPIATTSFNSGAVAHVCRRSDAARAA